MKLYIRFCALFFLFVFSNHQVEAISITWIGTAGNWNDATKWLPAQIPTNADDVIVEHSTDGRIFHNIGKIDGAGISTHINDYNFTHKNPINGINYYRLKQVDFDGNFDYSKTISVDIKPTYTGLTLFPNPVGNKLNLKLDTPSEISFIQVYDVHGKLKTNISVYGEILETDIYVADFPPGMYYLKMGGGHIVRQAYFIKK